MQFPLGKKEKGSKLLLALSGLLASTMSVACPSLEGFYDALEDAPAALVEPLGGILEQCYTDSEYFALVGAAHLRSGDLLRALENF